jgi:hypothetical protein
MCAPVSGPRDVFGLSTSDTQRADHLLAEIADASRATRRRQGAFALTGSVAALGVVAVELATEKSNADVSALCVFGALGVGLGTLGAYVLATPSMGQRAHAALHPKLTASGAGHAAQREAFMHASDMLGALQTPDAAQPLDRHGSPALAHGLLHVDGRDLTDEPGACFCGALLSRRERLAAGRCSVQGRRPLDRGTLDSHVPPRSADLAPAQRKRPRRRRAGSGLVLRGEPARDCSQQPPASGSSRAHPHRGPRTRSCSDTARPASFWTAASTALPRKSAHPAGHTQDAQSQPSGPHTGPCVCSPACASRSCQVCSSARRSSSGGWAPASA